MATTARTGRPTIEQVIADAKAGVFDDRLDVTVPPELFGPPTAAEKRAGVVERANGTRPSGAHAKKAPRSHRARG
jgi:hypothetical protein